MYPKLAINYYNGLLELIVLDDFQLEATDYEIWDEVPKLNVSFAVADGRIVRKGEIVSFMALRFHEDAPVILKALESAKTPSKYDVPELGLTGAPLKEILKKVHQQYTQKSSKGNSPTEGTKS